MAQKILWVLPLCVIFLHVVHEVTCDSEIAHRHDAQFRVINDTQVIPRTILQVSSTFSVTEELHNAIHGNINLNPEYTHYYFDHTMARAFIEKKFGHRHVAAFDAVVPHRYKEDLFKYCWLVENGGVVLDTNYVLTAPLNDTIGEDVSFVGVIDSSGEYRTDFIASGPNHWILSRTLEAAIANINEKRRVTCADCLVGGTVLTRIANSSQQPDTPSPLPRLYTALDIPNKRSGNVLLHFAQKGDEVIIFDEFPSPHRKDNAVATLGKGCRYTQREHLEQVYTQGTVFKTANAELNHRYECLFGEISKDLWKKIFLVDIAARRDPRLAVEPRLLATNLASTPTNTLIPKRILQLGAEEQVLPSTLELVERLTEVNADYGYTYIARHRFRWFVAEQYNSEVLSAYDSLSLQSQKDEFFRYCWLYLNGGVYIDSSYRAVSPLRDIVRSSDEIIIVEEEDRVGAMFLAAAPRHPILERVITVSTKRILGRKIGTDAHSVTGGTLLREALNQVIKETKTRKLEKAVQVLSIKKVHCTNAHDELFLCMKQDKKKAVTSGGRHCPLASVPIAKIAKQKRYGAEADVTAHWRNDSLYTSSSVKEVTYWNSPQSNVLEKRFKKTSPITIRNISTSDDAKSGMFFDLTNPAFMFDRNLDTFFHVTSVGTSSSWIDLVLGNPVLVGASDLGTKSYALSKIKLYLPRSSASHFLVSLPLIQLYNSFGDFIAMAFPSSTTKENVESMQFATYDFSGLTGVEDFATKIRLSMDSPFSNFVSIAELEFLTKFGDHISGLQVKYAETSMKDARTDDIPSIVSVLEEPVERCNASVTVNTGGTLRACMSSIPTSCKALFLGDQDSFVSEVKHLSFSSTRCTPVMKPTVDKHFSLLDTLQTDTPNMIFVDSPQTVSSIKEIISAIPKAIEEGKLSDTLSQVFLKIDFCTGSSNMESSLADKWAKVFRAIRRRYVVTKIESPSFPIPRQWARIETHTSRGGSKQVSIPCLVHLSLKIRTLIGKG